MRIAVWDPIYFPQHKPISSSVLNGDRCLCSEVVTTSSLEGPILNLRCRATSDSVIGLFFELGDLKNIHLAFKISLLSVSIPEVQVLPVLEAAVLAFELPVARDSFQASY